VLASEGETLGIWDRHQPARPVATFDSTDEGGDAAFDQFRRLERVARPAVSRWLPALVLAAVIGVIAWAATAGLSSMMETRVITGLATQRSEVRLLSILNAVESTAFALWVGSLALTGLFWARARIDRDR
jgi:hypothetical protein